MESAFFSDLANKPQHLANKTKYKANKFENPPTFQDDCNFVEQRNRGCLLIKGFEYKPY